MRLVGTESLPFFPHMAEVLEPALGLLEGYATEYAQVAEERGVDPQAEWIAFHFWLADSFNTRALDGGFGDDLTLAQARWLLYATCYWGGVEQRMHVAQPTPPVPFSAPTAESTSGMSAALVAIDGAVSGSAEAKFASMERLLRTAPGAVENDTLIVGSLLFGTAYDTFYMTTVGEAPPVGQRNPALRPYQAGNVAADPQKFLEISYADPIPSWLEAARAAYADVKTTQAAELEQLLVGTSPGDVPGGANDLRTMWSSATALADAFWGGNATERWTQGYFDANMHGNVRWNWGLEAISMTALTALVRRDAKLADQALVGDSLYVAAWSGFFYGLQSAPADQVAPLPTITPR